MENREIRNVNAVYWNLSTALLTKSPFVVGNAVRRRAVLPNDKFIMDEPTSADKVGWGKVNRPMEVANSISV